MEIKLNGQKYKVEKTNIETHANDPLWLQANLAINVYCYIKGKEFKVKNHKLIKNIYKKMKE